MRIASICLALLASVTTAFGQPKDVTNKYIENADFGARFAAWVNPGSFTYNTNETSFEKRNGQVWMEKWVAKGSMLGTNTGMYQTLRNLPTGTYTLVVAAKNVNQNSPAKKCTGAFVYAGQEQTEISEANDYSVVFTVVNGKADIGVRLKSCSGNWVCIDNFRLYYNGENADSIAAEQTRVDSELAALKEKVANANATSLKVTTYDFVPTGNTIALGRSTVSGTCKEKGFCWSTEGEPTIFDEKTTETFDKNGAIYVMRGLKPATAYYVRAYAMTNGGYVAYGAVKKIVTLPAGNMTYGFFNDNNGDAETCARINSASAECIWMYNQLSYIPGFYLSVHYVPGAGAGDGTADCSYGGWMRVSQKNAYQQTGTMLHETNHGVGVGTTGEWYNNANLRAETSRGLWLGPMGTKMVRFFDNSATSTMTGDGTHMWPYGINGAGEDRYQPSDHCLYFANILITHALHQDGLPCTSGVGFASPAYVFEQNDTTKYYIKNNGETTGLLTGYLYATSMGVKWNAISSADAKADDNYAWYIKYDPATRLYYFQNVGTGKMITYSSGYKTATRTNPTAAEKLHLMPARVETTIGSGKSAVKKTAYWVMQPAKYNSQALTATTSGISATKIDLSNTATSQQWIFLTSDEMDEMESAAMEGAKKDFNASLQDMRALLEVPHSVAEESQNTDQIFLAAIIAAETKVEQATSPATVTEATSELQEAMLTFLSEVTATDASQPFNLTFLLSNPNFDTNGSGWSETPAWGSSACEFYQTNFDFSQTINLKMPAGNYELRAQAFQRPGTLDDIYLDYFTNGQDKVSTNLYLKTKNQKVKNIGVDASTRSYGTGSVQLTNKMFIPNSLGSAQAWFNNDCYDNSVWVATTSAATMKLGIKSTNNAGGGYWTAFDNFRLYFYGQMSKDEATAIQCITPSQTDALTSPTYDLQGRPVSTPAKGLYIKGGKKIIVR